MFYRLLPAKLLREWTALFIEGKPIYDIMEESSTELTAEQLLELERQALLNETDLNEYRVRPQAVVIAIVTFL